MCNYNEIVQAPAGAGKTRRISKTVDNLIESGVSPDKILCITFTNLATRNMRKAVNEDVHVSTLHSLVYSSVIKQSKLYIADDSANYIALEDILSRMYGSDNIDKMCNDMFKAMSKYKLISLFFSKDKDYSTYRSLINSDAVNTYFVNKNYKFKFTDPNIVGYVCEQMYKFYETNNLISFDDMIIRGAFECRLDVEHIFVDECQDLSVEEYIAVTSISNTAKIHMFGDVHQSIYQWRGANPVYIIKQFRKHYQPKEFVMDTVYRSGSNIVSLGNKLLGDGISYKFNEYGGSVSCRVYDTADDELNGVIKQVKEDLNSNKRVAILSRANNTLKPYIQYCRDAKMPFHSKSSKSYKNDPASNIALQIFGLRSEKFNDVRFHNILYSSVLLKHAGVSREDLNNLNIRKYPAHLFLEGSHYYYPLINKESRSGRTFVVFDVESTGLTVGEDRIIQISGSKLNDDFEVIDEIDIIINPEKSVGESEKTHHFSDVYLKENGVSSYNGLKTFLEFVGDSYMVGHNVSYDKAMLECECVRVGLDLKKLTYYDTLSISRFVIDSTTYKLGDLINLLGIEANPNHNAMEDVRATVKLFIQLCDKLYPALNVLEHCFNPSKHVKIYIEFVSDMVRNSVNCDVSDVLRTVNKYLRGFGVDNNERYKLVELNNELQDLISSSKVVNDYTLYNEFQLSSLPSTLDRNLSILSVHQSKGLEWDKVYLIGCSSRYTQSDEDLRIEYVAVTRAKESITVSCVEPDAYTRVNRIVEVIRGMQDES